MHDSTVKTFVTLAKARVVDVGDTSSDVHVSGEADCRESIVLDAADGSSV